MDEHSVNCQTGNGNSIWTEDYVPNSAILVTEAAESFPNGGRKGFLAWLKDRLTITNTESIEHHQGVDAVWRKFSSVFTILNTIIFYEPIFRLFMRRMMQQLLADGVKWVDLRLAFKFFYYAEGKEEPEATYEPMFKVFGEEIAAFKASEEGKEFWGARMIWTGIRALDTRNIIEDMDACIAIKLAYPSLIAGYDLVGQEDGGRPLKDLLPELFWFRKQCAQEGIDIPFFFHAGECLGDGNATDQNLFDAVLLGTRRIGHGFSLYKHPLLIDMVKEKKILVESCPISNEVLRLCASVMSHPLPALLARGVSCSLCNDDPAILGQDTAGMTHDFWQALQGWDNLGLAGLGSLAENSVRWAAFEDQNAAAWVNDIKEASLGNGVRAERMKQWSIEWEQFCLWIVTEYGDEGGSVARLRVEIGLDSQG
jgi:adenosine deaminase CECR1